MLVPFNSWLTDHERTSADNGDRFTPSHDLAKHDFSLAAAGQDTSLFEFLIFCTDFEIAKLLSIINILRSNPENKRPPLTISVQNKTRSTKYYCFYTQIFTILFHNNIYTCHST
jgi:hypothetical protein